jgi:YHS domain-containing protein/uncharacterized membrane protein YraQ (UPF0718 family)
MHVLVLIGESLREAFFMFWETLWALVLGFGLSGAVQAFVSRSEMRRVMGKHNLGSLARATFFGMVSSSCSYAASAMAKSLFQKGANFTAAMVFMFASTNLVIELGLVLWVLLGWQFAASEFIGGLIMIGLFALASRFVFTPAVVGAARRRLGEQEDGPEESEEKRPWRERLISPAGWADAASYTMADITMLRKEMAIGYLVAGFLAVLVPASVWRTVFLSGHGFLTSLENVLVGPLIAIISFVCSIGNVPLAAALWEGGISFGGVVSFVFADLITLPLILIYRRFYGGRLTLRLILLFWGVMSAAGLATEYLFLGLGIIPERRPALISRASFGWDHTTFLNIAALVVFGGLLWLSRNRERFGGGKGYAIDPVCGMQVQIGNAPARAVHGGKTYYFCSDRCRERFLERPERFAAAGAEPEGMHEHPAGEATDPVCSMKVDPENAAATRTHGGRAYYFCSEGCAKTFEENPERYLKESG